MSQSSRLRSLLAMGASAAVLSAVAAPAFAQQASGQQATTVIEELVVTAQKKEEALQDVPIAVSAFSQDSLEAQKIDGGPNLQLAIPNVTFAKGNFTNSFNFADPRHRQQGRRRVDRRGVGVHENNAPLQSGNLFDAEFFDVERVEVLRGPQGTLYGRNATGGVVNIITAKPTDTFEGEIRRSGQLQHPEAPRHGQHAALWATSWPSAWPATGQARRLRHQHLQRPQGRRPRPVLDPRVGDVQSHREAAHQLHVGALPRRRQPRPRRQAALHQGQRPGHGRRRPDRRPRASS
jgi:outer membrane receptor protein involved in Fe transport